MGWIDDIKGKVASAGESLKTEISKYRNDGFRKAAVAACAIVAAADGRIDDAEIEDFLSSVLSSALSVFPVAQIDEEFRARAGRINANKTVGVAEALQALAPLKGKPEATLVVGIAKSVAEQGGIDASETAALRKICSALAIDPTLFDL